MSDVRLKKLEIIVITIIAKQALKKNLTGSALMVVNIILYNISQCTEALTSLYDLSFSQFSSHLQV